MIELPRAALRAGEIAEYADFFSFGTNDLTQTALGFSRDDAESALPGDLPRGRRDRAQPVRERSTSTASASSCASGSSAAGRRKPGIKLGICGEHGGDPASVAFFHTAGLDYVSCSPFRVPIARLAAARAALGDARVSEPAIDAALTPGEALQPCGVAIVVDTIRATTTALYALRQGYAEVICCGSVEDARAAAAEIGAGAILAGERECVRIEGFHLGNSPREFDAGQPLGDVLVLTTTNGTRAVLQAQAEANVVLVGALANLSATAAHAARLTRTDRGRVAVRCAGVRGAVALDDAYTAGRLVDALTAYLPGVARGRRRGAGARRARPRSRRPTARSAPRRARATSSRPSSPTTCGCARRSTRSTSSRWPSRSTAAARASPP